MTISSKSQQFPDFVRKTPSIRQPSHRKQDPYQPLIAIYLLRLALGMKDKLSLDALTLLFQHNLGDLTGLSAYNIPAIDNIELDDLDNALLSAKPQKCILLRHIHKRLKQLLAQGMQIDTPLFTNIKWLAAELQLSVTDQEILVLSLLMAVNSDFGNYADAYCDWIDDTALMGCLRLFTTRPIAALQKSLQPDSPLRQIGWLDASGMHFDSRLLVPPTIVYTLCTEHVSADSLRQIFFKPLKKTALRPIDFPVLQNDLQIVAAYLQATLARKQSGVNLIIYGSSSISKRELAKLLAKMTEVNLYEVSRSDNNQLILEKEDRLAACQFTQYWLSQRKESALIVMDDAEDVLPQKLTPSLFEDELEAGGINPNVMARHMNNNPLPILWIVENPKEINSKFLTRFEYAMEVDKMPAALRRRQISKATRRLSLTPGWQEQLIQHPDLPLKQIEKAVHVAEFSQEKSGFSAEEIMQKVLNSHIQLFKRPVPINQPTTVTGYHLDFTNTSVPLNHLLVGLQRHRQGNFCFYGAPGTGKTAFARHLAEQLGLPLLIKRASDIFDKYIGESEKNQARMFQEAQRQGAILLLDEADSLLADRRDARHSWEISQVNEMLTQMEQFNGIFICTTNLMARMDAASLRRFDFKVKFDYLTPEQRWALFMQESQQLGAEFPQDEHTLQSLKQRIQGLPQLTPGDFAVLKRQARFLIEPYTLDDMIVILQQECLAKGETFATIGFVH